MKSKTPLAIGVLILSAFSIVYTIVSLADFENVNLSKSFSPNSQVASVEGVGSGLVAWWKFDEGSGTTATDSSGNGNTGTLVNNPTWTTGKIGQGLSFDGTDDYVNAGSLAVLDNLSAMSISLWTKPNSIGQNSQGYFISKQNNGVGWRFQISNTSACFVVSYDETPSSLTKCSISEFIKLNEWNHFTVVWDGSPSVNNIHIYLNGSEINYGTIVNPIGNRMSDESGNIVIGNNSSVNRTFDGHLDDVRIYNRTLSFNEVNGLYNIENSKKNIPVSTDSKHDDDLIKTEPVVDSRTYIIKKDGSGSFSTIQKCADTAKVGDVCLIESGIYSEHVRTKAGGTDESHRIIFKADGKVTMQGFDINHPYVTVDGFDITGYTSLYQANIGINSGGNFCKILNNTIRDGSDSVYGVYFFTSNGIGANGCIVRNNIFNNLSAQFFTSGGSNHLIEDNTWMNLNGWDVIRVFGHDIIFRRNFIKTGYLKPGIGNHPDFIQTFGNNGGEAYNIIFEENWIQDLADYQMGQTTTDGDPDFHDFIFRRNIFVNISSNMNIGIPGVQFYNNTFYRTAYSGGGIGFGGSPSYSDASRTIIKGNAFVEGGEQPDSNGLRGYYSNSGGTLSKNQDLKFLPNSTIIKDIFNNLIDNGYIDANGHPQQKAKALTEISQFIFDPTLVGYKSTIYNILIRVVQLDISIRQTFQADYNFVAGLQSAGFPLKRYFGSIAYTGSSEPHGINGGDPKFQNINNALGPDGIPFTLDDGLKPLPNSPLCSKGEGGTDIGAYSCNPNIVFAGGGTYIPIPINASCSSTLNQCNPGTSNDIADTSTHYLWQCLGSNGGTTASCSLPKSTSLQGDFDNNGLINSIDISMLFSNWNTSLPTCDLNKDGIVNSLDYVIVVKNWTV